MTDAVTVDTSNTSQTGEAPIPNIDRVKPTDVTGLTPEQIAAAAAKANEGKTPEQIAADEAAAAAAEAGPKPAVEAPVIGEADDERPAGPTSADADENGVITYEPTGDAGLDVALAFAGKLGLGMDDPAMMATADGDYSLIKAKLATMGEKAAGWEQMVALVEQAHTRHKEKTTAANTAISNAVSGVLGTNQAAVLKWASDNADEAERKELNAMLAAGPVQARAAANLILGAYRSAGGTVVSPASATTATLTGGDVKQSNVGPLTNKEFARETDKLHRQFGAAYINRPEYRALAARLPA